MGSCFGPVGTIAGGVIGGINWGLQLAFPHLYDDIKEGAYNLYDGVVAEEKKMGKAVRQGVKSIKHAAGNALKDVGDTLSNGGTKCIPKIPKLVFGW